MSQHPSGPRIRGINTPLQTSRPSSAEGQRSYEFTLCLNTWGVFFVSLSSAPPWPVPAGCSRGAHGQTRALLQLGPSSVVCLVAFVLLQPAPLATTTLTGTGGAKQWEAFGTLPRPLFP